MTPPVKTFVCQCGQKFECEMTLAVHCNLVSHKFHEHIIPGTKPTSLEMSKKMREKSLLVIETNSIKIYKKFFGSEKLVPHLEEKKQCWYGPGYKMFRIV